MREARTLLMVDDNPADVDLAREALQDAYHCQIASVGNGEDALAFVYRKGTYAEKPRPDLVVLDLNLPKIHGLLVLEELKSNPDLNGIPVVIFSTSRLSEDVSHSYQLGANCYVNKPGSLHEFLAAVRGIEEFWFGLSSLPQRGE
jgi:chemotaxis family two-component system response regulator Rcp1